MRTTLLIIFGLSAALGCVQPVGAQNAKNDAVSRLSEQVRRMQDTQQKLQRENARLLESQAKADESIKAAQVATQAAERERERSGALRREVQARDERIAQAEHAAEAARRETEALKARAAELEAGWARGAARLQTLEAQLKGGEAALQQARLAQEDSGRRLDQCAKHNDAMASLSQDLLAAVERSGKGDVLIGTEPFSGFKRVRIQTLIQDWRDRIDDQRTPAPAAGIQAVQADAGAMR
jgi:chromosome segregation ATPase